LLLLQGEIFAAEGYAKTTGDVGVCIATSGPGATNLVTGLADALLDSVPMVAITGQVPRKLIGTDAFQETPIVEVTRQITKHNYLVMDIADLPRYACLAIVLKECGKNLFCLNSICACVAEQRLWLSGCITLLDMLLCRCACRQAKTHTSVCCLRPDFSILHLTFGVEQLHHCQPTLHHLKHMADAMLTHLCHMAM
jgi:hypothetical protein